MTKILLIEDKKFYRDAMKEACKTLNSDSIEMLEFIPQDTRASQGKIESEFRNFISKHEFDIIFTDFKLWSNFTGISAIKIAKKFPWYNNAIVVAFSGVYPSNQHLQDNGARYYGEDKPTFMEAKEARRWFLDPAILDLKKLRS